MNRENEKKMNKVIICGFDFEQTQKRAEHISERYGPEEYSMTYVPTESHEDGGLICHMMADDDTGRNHRYIRLGGSDMIYARTPVDACRNFDFLRHEGLIEIENADIGGLNCPPAREEAFKYLKTLADKGDVRTLIHCKSNIAEV